MITIRKQIEFILNKHGINNIFTDLIVNDMETLIQSANGEPKSELPKFIPQSEMEKGHTCVTCGQRVKIYKRTLYDRMARGLAWLYKAHRLMPGKDCFHHQEDLKIDQRTAGDFAKLKHWGFMEEAKKGMDEDKRTSGRWRITEKGIQFIQGEITVPKYVKLYNKAIYGFEGPEITVFDVLGEKFSYKALIAE